MRESDAALWIAKYVRRGLLDNGHEVICTRSNDKFVGLLERCEIANENRCGLLLSIHCNAFSNQMAHGYEVWTSVGQTRADPIAERLFVSIGGAFPSLMPRFDKTDGDNDKEAGFVVLMQSRMPAVLVETCFISNPLEEKWLHDPGWRMRMAGSIVTGIGRAT